MTDTVATPAPLLPAPVQGATVGDPSATAARLERVAGLLLRRLRPTRPGDLTRSQASLLATVRDHGPLSLSALAALEVVQAPTASRAVDTLVQRDLLRREVDAVDHRRHVIALAPGAADLLDRRSREAVRVLAARLDGLGDDDRVAVMAALPALEGLVDDLGASTADRDTLTSDV